MNELQKRFDWLAFLVRFVASTVFGTLWLADSIHRHNRTGAIVAISIGYVILPVIAYFHTRYYNTKFSATFVEAVRRRTGGRTRAEPGGK